MKSSIALCTYNGEKYLEAQLNSYVDQTTLPDELIVCDDGSTDKTRIILQSFKERSPFPVHIIFNEARLGSTRNFAKAISLCNHEIIFLSDQDDIWRKDKIKIVFNVFLNSPKSSLVFSNAELMDEVGNSYHTTYWDKFPSKDRRRAEKGRIIDVLIERNMACGATLAFKKDFLQHILPIPVDSYMIHDWWIAYMLTSVSEVSILNESLIFYRQHSGQQTGMMRKATTPKNADENVIGNAIRFYTKRLQDLDFILSRLDEAEKTHRYDVSYLKRSRESIASYKLKVEQAIRHFSARNLIAASKKRKLLFVFKETFSGRYFRFSRGLFSIAKDLFR